MEQTLQYLYDFAFSHHIGINYNSKLTPYAPSLSRGSTQTIYINMNWHNKKEIPFIIAHEISHLLNKDVGILYYTTGSSRSKIEKSANTGAIDILIGYADYLGIEQVNVVKFMEEFGIPSKFENLVMNRLGNRFSI